LNLLQIGMLKNLIIKKITNFESTFALRKRKTMAAPKGNKNAIGNEGGHPKTGIDILWDDWYNDILELYSKGASDVEIRALIAKNCASKTKASYTLWDRWIEEEIEFSETIKMGRIFSEAWWNKISRENLENKDFSFTGWYMNMKNRFGWRDKSEVENTHTVTPNAKEFIDDLLK